MPPVWRQGGKKMEPIIYKATNRNNGKAYVGFTTKGLEARRAIHEHKAKKGLAGPFYRAIRKYGAGAFNWEVLAVGVDPDWMLKEMEPHYIEAHGTRAPKGYNLTDGGEGLLNPSPETRAKIGLAHRGKRVSPETRAKTSVSLKGHPTSPETRAKVAASNRRRGVSPETRAKLSAAAKRHHQRRREEDER